MKNFIKGVLFLWTIITTIISVFSVGGLCAIFKGMSEARKPVRPWNSADYHDYYKKYERGEGKRV